MPPCLTLSSVRYGSRVKWSNPGKEYHPPLHLGVVAIEKGAFGSHSTMVANFTFIYSLIESTRRTNMSLKSAREEEKEMNL